MKTKKQVCPFCERKSKISVFPDCLAWIKKKDIIERKNYYKCHTCDNFWIETNEVIRYIKEDKK